MTTTKREIIVEITYFDGCPNYAPVRDLVERVLSERGIPATIIPIEVTDTADAHDKRFLGSPSVRINGIDVDASIAGLDRFGMMCRVYRDGDVASDVPSRRMIEHSLSNATATQQ